MPHPITVTEARARLSQILDRVLGGEEVLLTRYGRPVAAIVRPDRLRRRRADDALAQAERVRDLLTQARRTELSDRSGMTRERADELVAEVYTGRSRR